MGPIRGVKRRKKAEKEADRYPPHTSVPSLPLPLDWWQQFSKRINVLSPEQEAKIEAETMSGALIFNAVRSRRRSVWASNAEEKRMEGAGVHNGILNESDNGMIPKVGQKGAAQAEGSPKKKATDAEATKKKAALPPKTTLKRGSETIDVEEGVDADEIPLTAHRKKPRVSTPAATEPPAAAAELPSTLPNPQAMIPAAAQTNSTTSSRSSPKTPRTEKEIRDLVDTTVKESKGALKLASPPSRSHPEVLMGLVATRRAMDFTMGKEFLDNPPSADQLEARIGLGISEIATAAFHQNQAMKALEGGLRTSSTQNKELGDKITQLCSRLCDAKAEAKKKEEEAAAELKQKAEEAAEELRKMGVELQRVKGERDRMEEKVGKMEAAFQARTAEMERAQADFQTQLAQAKATAAVRAVAKYREGGDFLAEITERAKGFFEVGLKHFVRRMMVDPMTKDAMSIGKAVDLSLLDCYDAEACRGHVLVPYDENDLKCIQDEDDAAGLPVWVPLEVDEDNYDSFLAAWTKSDNEADDAELAGQETEEERAEPAGHDIEKVDGGGE